MVRPSGDLSKTSWQGPNQVEVVRADLRRRGGLADVFRGVDCVLHLAAAKSGDLYKQFGDTVVATENLLAAMTEAGVNRIVAISSFSVYDCLRLRTFGQLDEDSPLEKDAFDRDDYAQAKLAQERLVRQWATEHHWHWTILRPGIIWGKNNLFNARLGVNAGRVWIRTGTWARLPLTYVESCAQAIVLAAESDAAKGQILNVIDDEQPTQRRFANLIRKRMQPRPFIIPIPFLLMNFIAATAWQVNRRLLRGQAKVPGLFVPARLHARCKPVRFSNQRIKRLLGWTPRYSLLEALDRSTDGSREPCTAAPDQSSKNDLRPVEMA